MGALVAPLPRLQGRGRGEAGPGAVRRVRRVRGVG